MVRVHYYPYLIHAGVVELVDTPGLGPGASSHTGSNPVPRTGILFENKKKKLDV